MKITVYQVDAFTTELFSGNPAGVVPNADGMTDRQMQQLARELNNSETAFIFDRQEDGADIEVRFFTPTREVPICGHATISAHYVYAKERGLTNCVIRQKTKAGVLPVEIAEQDGDLFVTMTQAGIVFGDMIRDERLARLLEGLGLAEGDLEEKLPVQIVSTGHSKVMVPIRSKDRLDALAPDAGILSALSREIDCNGYYVFTFDSREEGVLTSGRMFAPASGIAEDPVTGNANGPLGAYLTYYGKLPPREDGFAFTIKQGEAIGRKGYMQVIVRSFGGDPVVVKIGGRARIVFKTEIEL